MTRPPPDTETDAPFGTVPRRTHGLLYALMVLFAICLAVLVWLAAAYPAR